MKPRLLTILLLLALGAVSTVAVAWACAAWVPVGTDRIVGYSERGGVVTRADHLGTMIVGSYPDFVVGGQRAAQEDVIPAWAERQIAIRDNQWFFAAGWPLRALECRMDLPKSPDEEMRLVGGFWLGARPAPPIFSRGRSRAPALPYRPIRLGFAINTLMYAVVLGLLFLAPRTVRRAYRARRQRCRRCGYPIGASPACTECGALVRAVSE